MTAALLVFAGGLVVAILVWLKAKLSSTASKVTDNEIRKVFDRATKQKDEMPKSMTHEEISNALRDIRDRSR